ncbi:hypothetical protein BMS3Abin16_01881 [archaeon BMS3Abin16]|nr:hypothetical protein BMS3Abin16_01881 [archaeon BMS3Abin16]
MKKVLVIKVLLAATFFNHDFIQHLLSDLKMNAADEIIEIFTSKGISQNARAVIVTCVDPDYNAASLADDVSDESLKTLLAGLKVWYDSSNVQQAAPGWTQFAMAYTGREKGFVEIDKKMVKDSLQNGVVQIAVDTRGKTVVLAIPGDCYAFNLKGAGFAFGQPHAAGPDAATMLLQTILDCAVDWENGGVNLVLMAHPDCRLYAFNEGDIKDGKSLSTNTFLESTYHKCESHLKNRGFLDLSKAVSHRPNLRVLKAVPNYSANRTPCISDQG